MRAASFACIVVVCICRTKPRLMCVVRCRRLLCRLHADPPSNSDCQTRFALKWRALLHALHRINELRKDVLYVFFFISLSVIILLVFFVFICVLIPTTGCWLVCILLANKPRETESCVTDGDIGVKWVKGFITESRRPLSKVFVHFFSLLYRASYPFCLIYASSNYKGRRILLIETLTNG